MNSKINSLEELQKFAEEILQKIQPQKDKATIVALSGDLGSGKTAFVKAAAKYFGIKDTLTSPTFVILKKFLIPSSDSALNANRYTLLSHIDAYRLEKGEELLKLRWEELLGDPKNIIFVEWPEKVSEIIPKDAILLKFTFIDETTRGIEV